MRTLARRYGINQKTVAKWKGRRSVADLPAGPKKPKSTVLCLAEEAIVAAFRKQSLLPLDDCLYALQAMIPHLTRSSLHRCLRRHGISRLPDANRERSERKKLQSAIGCFHFSVTDLRTPGGKLYFLMAIDRASKFAFVQCAGQVDSKSTSAFFDALVEAVPYRIDTVLSESGIAYADFPKDRLGSVGIPDDHSIEQAGRRNGIAHPVSDSNQPWVDEHVEGMNRIIKDTTVERCRCKQGNQLSTRLAEFVNAYNFTRRLKTLGGLTPYEYVCKALATEPSALGSTRPDRHHDRPTRVGPIRRNGSSPLRNLPRPSLHIPVPASRPGEAPDFSHIEIPEAGSVRRPDTAADPAEMRDLAYDLIRVLGFDHQAVGPWNPRLDAEKLREALQLMILNRAFEQRVYQAQRQGKMSFYMPGLGEEAISIAHAFALSGDDMCFTSYRQLGLLFARGCPIIDMLNQLYNNAGDKQQGLQVPLHYSFPDYGYFAMSGNLSTQVPQATGWAMAAAASGDSRISVSFSGEGSTAEGDFYAGLLLASIYRAPVIFSISNNQWAISSFAGISGGELTTFAARAIGVGLPALRVDGNDFLAAYAAVEWAAERARANHGATVIEFVTYRGHAHSTSDDPTRYRPAEEFAAWPLGDPLERLKGHLIALGEWSDDRHSAYEKEAKDQIKAVQREAEAIGTMNTGRKPSPRAMFDHVFEEPDWRLRRQRQQMGI